MRGLFDSFNCKYPTYNAVYILDINLKLLCIYFWGARGNSQQQTANIITSLIIVNSVLVIVLNGNRNVMPSN